MAVLPAHGYEEVVGFDVEKHPDLLVTDNYGVAIDPVTNFLRAISVDINPVDNPIPRPSASGVTVAGNYMAGTPREIQLVPDIRGSVEAELDAHLFPFFLGAAMRVYGDPGLLPKLYEKAGAGPYTHTFRMPTASSPGPPGLTVARQTAKQNTKFGGGMIEQLEITGEPGNIAMFKADRKSVV